MQEEIKNWTNGAIVHVHARIEDELLAQKDEIEKTGLESYMENYKDGSFTLSAMTYFFENIFEEKIPITDTQHPAYILNPDYDDLPVDDKLKYFHPKAITSTLDLMTRCIIERKI